MVMIYLNIYIYIYIYIYFYSEFTIHTIHKYIYNIHKYIYSKINKEARAIANNYEIAERIDCLPMADAFSTLKDDKPTNINH